MTKTAIVGQVRSTGAEASASPPAALGGLPLVCPLCRGSVDWRGQAYHCPRCARTYPLHAGIPDFRVFPDPYLGFDEDRERTDFVLDLIDECDLPRLLERYWQRSHDTPEALRPKFIRSAMLAERKAQRMLRGPLGKTFQRPATRRRVLEIGSGTGGFLAAAGRAHRVVGVDIAMRWLQLSRRRFLDAGLTVPPLICCCAERLPFPDGYFDVAVASSVLEFARDPGQMLREAARTLAPSGAMILNTVNRFSLSTNPYAYLWGVGFLPCRWQAPYVAWRRGANYGPIRLLSLNELLTFGRKSFTSVEIILPDVDDEAVNAFSPTTRLAARIYRRARTVPGLRRLLEHFGPGWDARLSGPRPTRP